MKKEYILCAAIHYKKNDNYPNQPRNIENGYVVCGYRHDRCIAIITRLEEDYNSHLMKQGFLTSHNRFVDRQEGYKIACENEQIEEEKHSWLALGVLVSEDLY